MLAVYQVRRYCCGCRSLVCAFFVVCAEEAGSKTKTKKSKKRKIKKQSTIDYYCYRDRSVKNNFPAGNNYRLRRVWPGIWIAYTILPPPPQGPKKKTSQFFFLWMICVTIVPKRHAGTSWQISYVTSHHISRTTYYTWYSSGLLRGVPSHQGIPRTTDCTWFRWVCIFFFNF